MAVKESWSYSQFMWKKCEKDGAGSGPRTENRKSYSSLHKFSSMGVSCLL